VRQIVLVPAPQVNPGCFIHRLDVPSSSSSQNSQKTFRDMWIIHPNMKSVLIQLITLPSNKGNRYQSSIMTISRHRYSWSRLGVCKNRCGSARFIVVSNKFRQRKVVFCEIIRANYLSDYKLQRLWQLSTWGENNMDAGLTL
jgi:hypothetical protein